MRVLKTSSWSLHLGLGLMHPHAVAGTMESIRTPSPPADARVPRETPRGADGDIEVEACTVKPSLTGLGVKAP